MEAQKTTLQLSEKIEVDVPHQTQPFLLNRYPLLSGFLHGSILGLEDLSKNRFFIEETPSRAVLLDLEII